jgi:LuxR family maltose regulon positive regulatory protein
VYARLLLAQKKFDAALAVLDRLLAIAEPNGRIRSAIELHILKAIALSHYKGVDAAVQEVAHALSLAEEGGYITLFTFEGQPMADLIRKATKTKNLPYQFSFAYAKRVLEFFPEVEVASHPELLDELSERELDVLQCLAQGMSNKEIADSLYVSLNTVKTHLKRIHSKLDVKNRTEAVARGRELGFL